MSSFLPFPKLILHVRNYTTFLMCQQDYRLEIFIDFLDKQLPWISGVLKAAGSLPASYTSTHSTGYSFYIAYVLSL